MKKHMLPGNNALLKCFVVLMTILSAYSSNAQCNVGAESNPSPISPSGCSDGRVLLGSGANYSLPVSPNTYYNFSFSAGPNTNGFCATPQNGGASSFTSNQIGWFSGTTTTLLVSSSRVPGTPAISWSGISSTLTYRYTQATISSISVTPNPVCSGSNVTLDATTGSSFFFSWSGPGGYSSAPTSNPDVTVNGVTTGGTFTLIAQNPQTNGCNASLTSASLTVNPLATVEAGGPETVCESSTPYALTGASVGGGASTAAWSIISGSGTLSSTAQTASPSSVTFTPTTVGTVVLQLTTNDPSGPCGAVSDTRTITVQQAATVNAAGPDVVCQSGTAFNLSGATFGGSASSAAWSIVSGGGSLSSVAQTGSPATVTYTPSSSGTVTLRLTTNDPAGTCTAVTDDRTITVNAAATVNTGGTVTTCQSATPFALAGASVGGGATTGAWSITSGTGTLSTIAQTGSPASVTFTPTTIGTVVLTLTTNDPDGAGPCAAISATKTINVTSAPTANAGGPDVMCQFATITLSGATLGGGATTGAWSVTSGSGSLSTVAQTANPGLVTFTPTSTGTVQLTLTTNAVSPCSPATSIRTITVNPVPVASITVAETSGNANNDGTTCAGASVNLTGQPNSMATYSWSGGLGTGQTKAVAPTSTTSYQLTVTDANSCTGSASTTINVNPLPTPSISITESSGTANNDATTCSGDNATLTANPAAMLSYQWNNGLSPAQTNIVAPTSTTTYAVTVTNLNNCSASALGTVNVNPLPTPTISVTETSGVANNDGTICSASTVGLAANPGGLSAYSWNNGLGTGANKSVAPTATTTYTVTVTNSNNCTAQASSIITVNQYPVFGTPAYTAGNVLCNGGNTGDITINATASNPPLIYSIDNGSSFRIGNFFDSLVIGNYNLVIRDNVNCQTTYTFNPVVITQPTPLVHTTVVEDASCANVFDGKITISSSGATPPYSYSLNGGPVQSGNVFTGLSSGAYLVTTFDANGCSFSTNDTIDNSYGIAGTILSQTNVSCFGGADGVVTVFITQPGIGPYSYSINGVTFQPGGFSFTFSGLTAGNYIATIRDSKGCTAFVPVSIAQPNILQAQLDSIVNIACNGGATGAIYITVNGGTPGYTYTWSNGDSFEDIENLTAGTYNVIITDSKGCTTSAGATITQPLPLFLTIASTTNLRCYNDSTGKVDVTVSGGVPPYSFVWSNGATSEDIIGLHAGTYSLTVTDNNGCQQNISQTVTEPTQLTASAVATNVLCNGASTGAVDLTPAGGTTPYTYLWSNGATTQDISLITAGTYTAVVTDANSCSVSNTTVVTQPTALSLSTSVTNIACTGNASGSINLTVSGGAGGYTFAWSNASTTEDLTNLAPGTYTVTVTDANSCTATASGTITQPSLAISGTISSTDVTCNGAANGTVNLTITGGVQPYSYLWNNNATTEDLTGLIAGTYDVTATDANGCTFVGSVTINEPAALTATVTPTNVTCFGGNNGIADLTVTGGNPGYTYLWNNFATTQDLNGITAGNYVVIVNDTKGCQTIQTVTVTQPAQISITASVTNISCNGGTGSIDVTVSGGAGSFTYAWSNASTTEDQTGLTAGTYTLTVTDANSCTATATYTLTQPQPLAVSGLITNVTCNGAANGAVNITVTGGNAPFTFVWSNSAVTEDISGLSGNTYNVTVTDANSCTASGTYTVNEPTAIVSSIVGTNVTCSGANNGAADLTVSGGTTPYSYLWSNFQSTQDIANIGGGTYYVIITDANGCQKRDSVVITELQALVLSTTVTNVACNGGSTGAVNLSVTGGTNTYTYLWSTTATTEDVTGLSAGTYTVTATDGNGCFASASAIVTQPAALVLNATTDNVSCAGGADGSIDITVQGGVFPYSFAWSNSATTEDVNNLSGGSYTVTITDANGCTITGSYTITESNPILTSVVGTNVTCNGASNGAADLSVSGGTQPYSYLWSNFQASQDLSNIGGGTYYVIVTDANGCQKRDSVIITEPAALVLSTTVTNVLCNGASTGAINLTVTGGTGAYTFGWSNSTTTEDITGLAAGTYTVTVTDGNGCTATASATITQPAGLVLNATTTNVGCAGGANGSVDITVQGGVFPYSFAWSNSATTEDINGLSGGTYTVTITDANGCTLTNSYTITEPTGITTTVTGTNVTCNGASNGAADLSVSGGTQPYSYLWSNFQASQDLSNIGGGTYYVIVTDANGCQKRDSVIITEPAALVLSTTVTNVLCNGASTGAINLTVTGGTGAYTFGWSNSTTTEDITGLAAGTYTVTVTDGNGCTATASATITQPAGLVLNATTTNVGCAGGANGSVDITVQGGVFPYSFAWSNSATTEDINGLSGGTYTVTITDANGCTLTNSYTITEPTGITTTVTGTNVTCNGASNGAADLSVSGGTQPYSYLWSNFQASQDLSNIGGGTYYVIVTDANGCQKRDSVIITEPAALVLSTTVTNVLCNGASTGAINLTVTGGTGAYTFGWSNSTTTEDITGLAAGTYTVTVTDGNGCTATASATITQPAGLVLNATTTNVGCAGGANGSVDITVQGGVFPYSFAWSNSATTEDINGLSGGTYTVTITDANGCTLTNSYTITEPSAIVSSIAGTNVTCFGANNGAANLTVSGGTAPYTFLWSNFFSSEDLNNITAGTYFVIIKDANGCEKRDSVVITQPAALTLTTAVTNVLCNGAATGAIDLTVAGGVSPYDYTWSSGQNTQDLSNVVAGTYTVTVKDANNCTATATATITQPTGLVLTALETDVFCFGGNDGAINTTVSGGVQPYTFNWSNNTSTEDQNNLSAGTYTLTVTDANGCSVTATYVLDEPTAITSSISTTDVTCFDAKNGAANLTVSGGTPGYSFAWSNFQITEDLNNLDGGVYYVVITDSKGCTHRDSAVIDEPSQLLLSTQITQISCFNAANGAVDLTIAGGIAPYTYIWSNGATTEDLNGLSGATYCVTVTDANGCTASTCALIINPSAISTNAVINNPTCFGDTNGSINVVTTGGTPNYTFAWSANGVTTEDISNIGAGTYSLTITDANGCVKIESFVVTEPSPLFTSGFIKNVSCFGANDGCVDITAYGGTLPYTYSWSTGQSTEDICGLSGSNNTITVTDAQGCSVVSLYIVQEPAPLTVDVTGTNVSCFGGNNGTLTVLPAGGTLPYEYLWDDFNTDSLRTSVEAGLHVIMLTDSNGCHVFDSITLTQPSDLVITGVVSDAQCFNTPSGGIDITVTGGTPGYTYLWSNNATTEPLSTLAAGTYTVEVTDANGCKKSANFTVGQPDAIYLTLLTNKPTCSGSNNGSLSVVATNGVVPYTYAWNTTPVQTTASAVDLSPGNYEVTVTDGNGCTAVISDNLTGPTPIVVTTQAFNSNCFNTTDGYVVSTVTGGLPPYVYQLNGVTQQDTVFYGLAPGTYVLLVTDANSCQGSSTFTISSPVSLNVDLSVTEQFILTGMRSQLTAVITPDTVQPASIVWSPLVDSAGNDLIDFSLCGNPQICATPYATPRSSTTYTVTVVTGNGCSVSDTVTVYVSNELSKFIPTGFTPNGDGLNDRFEFDILGATNLDIVIYNRWGQQVYANPAQGNGITGSNGWDGKVDGEVAPADTYVWQMTVTYFDGTTSKQQGTINLMR